MSPLRWYGDRIEGALLGAARDAVRQAGMYLVTLARLTCNKPATRLKRRRRRTTSGGPKGSSYTAYVASRPSQPPALRTGFGRRNIDMEFDPDALTARVGVRADAVYMVYLELGTDRIDPRPWLKPATEQSRSAIDAIMRTALARGSR